MTQRRFAALLGYGAPAVSRWENGVILPPEAVLRMIKAIRASRAPLRGETLPSVFAAGLFALEAQHGEA